MARCVASKRKKRPAHSAPSTKIGGQNTEQNPSRNGKKSFEGWVLRRATLTVIGDREMVLLQKQSEPTSGASPGMGKRLKGWQRGVPHGAGGKLAATLGKGKKMPTPTTGDILESGELGKKK